MDLSDPGMPLLIALVWNAAAAVVSGPCWWLGVQPSLHAANDAVALLLFLLVAPVFVALPDRSPAPATRQPLAEPPHAIDRPFGADLR